jgi:hypothetical protein
VSKLEGKDDFYLSTLCKYVEALGGQLEMKAVFPDRTIDMTVPCNGQAPGKTPV